MAIGSAARLGKGAGPPPFTLVAHGYEYLLIERIKLLGTVTFPAMDAYSAQAVLRRAVSGDAGLAIRIQRRFTALFPSTDASPRQAALLAASAENLVARGSLVLIHLGPAACLVPAAPGHLPAPATCEPLFRRQLDQRLAPKPTAPDT